MNHYYDLVDQATRALGGSVGAARRRRHRREHDPAARRHAHGRPQVGPAGDVVEIRQRLSPASTRKAERRTSCTSIRSWTIKTRSSARAGTACRSRQIDDDHQPHHAAAPALGRHRRDARAGARDSGRAASREHARASQPASERGGQGTRRRRRRQRSLGRSRRDDQGGGRNAAAR